MVRSSQPDLKSLSCDQGFREASSWSHNLPGTVPPAPSLCPPGRQLPSTTHMQGRAPQGGSGCVCTEGPGLRLPAPPHPRALCVSKLQTTVQAPGASGSDWRTCSRLGALVSQASTLAGLNMAFVPGFVALGLGSFCGRAHPAGLSEPVAGVWLASARALIPSPECVGFQGMRDRTQGF